MKRLSIKFIGLSLLMFGLSFVYTVYMLFRVFYIEFLLSGTAKISDYLIFFSNLQSPFLQELFFHLDAAIIFFLIVIFWYFLIRFFISPKLRYFKFFIIIFVFALFYFLFPYVIIPDGFCEKYDSGPCPSFCSLKITGGSGVPEVYIYCRDPKLP